MGKDKEGLGSEVLRKHQSPPSCTSGSTAAAPRMKRVYIGERKGGMCELPRASYRLGSDRSPHFKLTSSAKEVVASVCFWGSR